MLASPHPLHLSASRACQSLEKPCAGKVGHVPWWAESWKCGLASDPECVAQKRLFRFQRGENVQIFYHQCIFVAEGFVWLFPAGRTSPGVLESCQHFFSVGVMLALCVVKDVQLSLSRCLCWFYTSPTA